MEYTEAQQKVIDRYLEATKDSPQDRMPLEKLIGVKSRFPRRKPDKYVISKCESESLTDEFMPETKKGRKKRVIDNRYIVDKFIGYDEYQLAATDFYWLDDVLTGVSNIAYEGATRPLSVHLLFDFLSTAESIDTDLIGKVCDVQERQARKIMVALVVSNRTIEKEFRRMDVAGLTHERRYLFLH